MYAELAHAWQSLKADNPKLRIRNAADRLGCSELDLLLTQLGDTVTWLNLSGYELARQLPNLGRLMSLVRNDGAVHETKGVFDAFKGGEKMGLFLGEQDQRLFLTHWRHSVFVNDGERQSIQVFDASGSAIIKLYRQAETHAEAWDTLVETHATTLDEPPRLTDKPTYLRHALVEPVEQLRQDWLAITDVHQFHNLIKRYGIDRLTAFEVAGSDLAHPVSIDAIERSLTACQEDEIPLMTFVSNTGAVQIHTEVPKRLLRTGPWFNILDPDFNLHLNTESLACAWISRRPTVDGWVTSLEAFDRDGRSVVQFFGERGEGKRERDDWRALMDNLMEEEGVTA